MRARPRSSVPIFGASPALILALFLGSGRLALGAPGPVVDPNTMKVNTVRDNLFVLSATPRFTWTVPGGVTQTNWQIQIDADPNFVGPLWFWDSGVLDKGSLNDDTNVPYSMPMVNTGNPSGSLLPVDRRSGLIYWRLRVQNNNSATWDDDLTNFSYGVFKLNQIPLSPLGLDVVADTNPGLTPGSLFPPLVTPVECFVATNGNDSDPNGGTQTNPFRTITKAVQSLTRLCDTITVRGGTYNENVRISQSNGARSGAPGNPITLRNFAGETAVVRAVASGSTPFAPINFVGTSGPIRHWIVDGLKLGGANSAVGVFINSAEFITVKNLSFESSFNANGTGVQMLGGGTGNRVLNSKFDVVMFDHIDIGGSQQAEIRGNEFANFTSHSAMQIHVSGSQAALILDNLFRDGTPTSAAVAFYLSSDSGVARNNIFRRIRIPPNGLGAGIEILRAGKIRIENNTFADCDLAISMGEWSRITSIIGNIFFRNANAVSLDLARGAQNFDFQLSASLGTVIERNFFFNNGKDLSLAFPNDANALSLAGNCPAAPTSGPSNNPACNPMFVDPNAGDFRLSAGSPAIDAADPDAPVPVGGGAVRDAGAVEFGALGTPPYDYQARAVVSDVTPQVIWSLNDPDNILNSLCPVLSPSCFEEFPDTDSQTGFELQLDTLSTFDSVRGSRPLFATPLVPSTTEAYTLPNINALPAGNYYARVRQRDQFTALGAWSNPNFRFLVASEPQAPLVTQQVPAPGAVAVDPNANVTAHVVDFGAGVNSSTIGITVSDPNGIRAGTTQIQQVGPTPADFLVVFDPSGPLPDGALITVQLQASDLFVPPNAMDPNSATYTFTIRDVTAPADPNGLRLTP